MPGRSELAVAEAMAGNQYLVYAGKKRLVVLGAAAFAFIALSVWIAVAGGSVLTSVLGLVGIAFGALCFIAYVRLLTTRNVPVIAFDADGVAFRGPFEKQYVAWSELESAYVAQVQRQRFVCLRPHDIEAALAAAPPARRKLMQANFGLTGAPLALPATSALSSEELLAIVVAYVGAWRARAVG